MRRKRNARQFPPPEIRLTHRDIEVFEALYHYRVLTQIQLQRLFFTYIAPQTARRRMRLLYDAAYLDRRFLLREAGIAASPTLYLLDRKANHELLKRGYDERRWFPKNNKIGYEHLEHLLDVNTVRIEIELACQQQGLKLTTWLDEKTLKQDYDRVSIPGFSKGKSLIPDGYFAIETPSGTSHFFLELDRGTETSKVFKRKIRAYLAYAKSNLLKQRFDITSFRVLTVAHSTVRANNLKAATERVEGKNKFWFTSLPEVSAATILTQPVWKVAGRDSLATLLEP